MGRDPRGLRPPQRRLRPPSASRLRELLTREQYRRAEASILNAHYTDPAVVAAIWDALRHAGFCGGRVLEPGCGSGTFIGHAPDDAVMVGVENDPITAAIAAALYPSAQVRHEGFETTRVPEDSFAAAIGNVPFGRFALHDPAHNPRRHSIHNHFIVKSLALTAPGGYVAVLTSRYTMDSRHRCCAARHRRARRPDRCAAAARRRRSAGSPAPKSSPTCWSCAAATDRRSTSAPSDPVAGHRRASPSTASTPRHGRRRSPSTPTSTNNPHHVLGTTELGHGLHGSPNLVVDGATGPTWPPRSATGCSAMIDGRRGARARASPPRADDLTVVPATAFDPGLITAADQGDRPPLYTLRYNAETRSIEYWAGPQLGAEQDSQDAGRGDPGTDRAARCRQRLIVVPA